MKNFLWALGVLALAAGIYEAVDAAKRSRLLPNGSPAPEFALQRYQGGQLQLGELKGQAVMLDFWATWCPPCVAEMPSLHQLAKEYESKGLRFVAANVDDPSNARAAVAAFVAQREPGLDPYVVFADGMVQARYKIEVYPTLYLIDRQGRVVDAMVGQQPEFIVRHRLEKALAP